MYCHKEKMVKMHNHQLCCAFPCGVHAVVPAMFLDAFKADINTRFRSAFNIFLPVADRGVPFAGKTYEKHHILLFCV